MRNKIHYRNLFPQECCIISGTVNRKFNYAEPPRISRIDTSRTVNLQQESGTHASLFVLTTLQNVTALEAVCIRHSNMRGTAIGKDKSQCKNKLLGNARKCRSKRVVASRLGLLLPQGTTYDD